MRRTILAVWFIATVLAIPAQAHPTWSLERAAVGVTAKAQTWQDTGVTAFFPEVVGVYSLTSALILAGSYSRDFAGDFNQGAADLVFRVTGSDRWQAGLSVGVAGYGGEGKDRLGITEVTSFRYGARASWTAWRDERTGQGKLYGIAQVHLDPSQRPDEAGQAQGLVSGTLGLRLALLGGKPEVLGYPEP